ncbi:hypothetical protein THRCLA_03145 [Thraustotheca clavata]|uniref:Uncharacterized protein n=1 Tax=Thraustotheca clavata TaxID=74557 RepID=A0A1W0A319_9STRA|nr:hypothetical protein THRCLA_03145 [Thraustotheca clavata]
MDNPQSFWFLLRGYGNVVSLPLYMFLSAFFYLGAFHVIYPACGRRLIHHHHLSLVRETAQSIAQLRQAYRLSQRDVNLEVTTGYTILVGISIVLSPWYFLFPDPFVLSFILATGFYLMFFIPRLLAIKFCACRQVYSMQWTISTLD